MRPRKHRRVDGKHSSGSSQLYFCDHCDENVVKRVFFDHKRKYKKDGVWRKKGSLPQTLRQFVITSDPFLQSSSDEENDTINNIPSKSHVIP